MDGFDRQAMGETLIHPANRPSAGRQARPALERSAQSAQWCVVDSAHGRALGRPAPTLRKPQDSASALSELGARWGDRKDPAGVSRRPAGEREARSQRMLHRRFVCSGEKRGLQVGKTKRGKGTKLMAIVDGHGLPLAGGTESASPAEVKLVGDTLENRWLAEMPEKLIGDKAYDSDPLDQKLEDEYGIEMIAPNRSNRKVPTQDLRPLRRYKRRWKVERLFAWLHNYRRVVVRWERRAENYTAFFHLACALILLRHL